MIARATRVWRAVPCKLVVILAAASLALGEFYPFSHYPMYARFKGVEYYVYVTDATGEPIPCARFHTTAAKLKKRFKGRLKMLAKAEDRDEEDVSDAGLAAIGRKTLASYLDEADRDGRMATVRELRMVLVNIGYEGQRIATSERVIATLPFDEPQPPDGN